MRITFISVVFLLFFLAISCRLFYWQVVKADELSSMAENQHFTDITLQAIRGKILFADGSVLASTQPLYILFGQPKEIKDDQKTDLSWKLAKVLYDLENNNQKAGLTLNNLQQQVRQKLSEDLYWVSLAKDLTSEQKEKIAGLNLTGIGFDQSSGRFYPEGSSSAHILGFVGADSKGRDKGYFGLEGYYDGELKGVSGLMKHERDAAGIPILIGQFLTSQPKNGQNLVLNVDQAVQFSAEEALKRGIKQYGAKSASAIVMNPKTGGILALASYPNYDPGQYFKYSKEYYKNSAVADQYEPGSTFKVLVMAAAINEGLVKPDTKCDICAGPIEMGGYSIRTWNNHYFPDSTMTDVIVHSDNTGMVFTAQKLGLDKFYQYLQNYGFGEVTNVDLQDEFSPDLRPKISWKEIDLATASFGQGIAVTPIQMVTAISAIANGGLLMEPHVVAKVEGDRESFEIRPKIVKRVFSPDAAKAVTEMMVRAVEDGEAKSFRVKGFKIAGKTGTAQIPVAGHYDPTKTIASFVGFAPADDPKFIILVRYDQPSSSIYGAETAAPTFFEIARDLFDYYKITPTEDIEK